MKLIRTENFALATIQAGNPESANVAIVIPGRLDTKDYAHNLSHVQHLGHLGFFAISFDPPGTWESPGSINLYTTTNYLRAVDELIKYFGNRPALLVGHSRGGTVSILAASRNKQVQGFIGIMPNFGPPTPPEAHRVTKGWVDSFRDLPPGSIESKEKIHFQLPFGYVTDGQQYDVMQSLETCYKPKLLFYGTRDEFEPPGQVLAKCQRAADPKKIIELEADHDYRRNEKAIEKVNVESGIFLKEYFSIRN